jgi:two-component system chemotaxis response regulator CheY
MDESVNLANLYILLVEPSRTQFHIVHDYLCEFGVRQLVSVETGAEALALMDDEKPDLVISAMHLPDMTGAQLVTTMRDSDHLRDISFILISSETSVRYLEPIKQAGVVAILSKPFTREQLKRALFTTLDFHEPERLEIDQFEPEDLAVLVVDDSTMARHHIRKVLNGLGFDNITEAADGLAAVKMIDDRYFDLIVSDYYMPAMDGTELASYIRENSKQPGIPILMVTSEENENRLAAIEQSGVSAVCGKPFEVSAIRNLVTTLLQS